MTYPVCISIQYVHLWGVNQVISRDEFAAWESLHSPPLVARCSTLLRYQK